MSDDYVTFAQISHDEGRCESWTCPYCAAERGERNDNIQWCEEWDDEEGRDDQSQR